MSMKHRMTRMETRMADLAPKRMPLTVFYVDATDNFPIGSRREVWDGIGLEVAVRPGSGIDDEEWPLIPGGPHKIVRGEAWEI